MTDLGLDRQVGGKGRRRGHRALWLIALFVGELVLLALAYQFLATIECQATDAEAMCRGLRSLVARALAVLAVAAVLAWARPGLTARFVRHSAAHPAPGFWSALHLGGIGLLLIPLFLAGGGDMAPMFRQLSLFWTLGALAAAAGAVLWLVPPAGWRRVAGQDARVLGFAILAGFLLPDLADLILPLWWHWPQLTNTTFLSVAAVLSLTGEAVHVDAAGYVIGLGDFWVHIAQQCSGVEGLALVSGFTLLYAVLFRHDIHPLRYWAVVLPLALLASWSLNVLRIAALIVIGDRISPTLAVDGFHSYAGWLFFTLLALGLMWAVQAAPWLHRAGISARVDRLPLRQDWLAARILPFIAFMIASTIAAAFFFHPELGYPMKAAIMAAALALFWPAYRGRDWAPSMISVVVGVAVGLGWLLSAPSDDADAFVLSQLLTGFGTMALVTWILCRVIGTVLLVPMIEELFFRGYVLARLDLGGPAWRAVALVVSSGLFGLMHDRWLEAAAAGLAFGAVMLWRGRLADALWAHVVANAVVALAAMIRGDWALI